MLAFAQHTARLTCRSLGVIGRNIFDGGISRICRAIEQQSLSMCQLHGVFCDLDVRRLKVQQEM